MQANHEFITVTIAKSHIITIGERLYTEGIEFVRELVNNAYDADATLVEVIATEDTIQIRDNGSGMNKKGLMQYFNIGSQQKLYSSKSPVYGEDSAEVFAEETTIYINRDHPLYKRESGKIETHLLNLARLITQEIAMMKDPRNPRQAFERQSKLLRDAFIERSS